LGTLKNFCQMRAQSTGQRRQAFPCELLFLQEEMDDGVRKRSEGEVTGANQPGPIHAGQESLLTQSLERVGGPFSNILRVGLRRFTDHRVDIVEQVLIEAGQRLPLASYAQHYQETELRRVKAEPDTLLLKRTNDAMWIDHGLAGGECMTTSGARSKPDRENSRELSVDRSARSEVGLSERDREGRLAELII
jgi:hypothetical protein